MRPPMVGSLIYGDHKIPKRQRPWRERWKMPAVVSLVFLLAAVLAYKYCNYRQERSVAQFLDDVAAGRLDQAYARWDLEGSTYSMEDFMIDWGADGYYTKGTSARRVFDSNSRGPVVIVYVEIDKFEFPIALRVNKETLKLSYSHTNKYIARAAAR